MDQRRLLIIEISGRQGPHIISKILNSAVIVVIPWNVIKSIIFSDILRSTFIVNLTGSIQGLFLIEIKTGLILPENVVSDIRVCLGCHPARGANRWISGGLRDITQTANFNMHGSLSLRQRYPLAWIKILLEISKFIVSRLIKSSLAYFLQKLLVKRPVPFVFQPTVHRLVTSEIVVLNEHIVQVTGVNRGSFLSSWIFSEIIGVDANWSSIYHVHLAGRTVGDPVSDVVLAFFQTWVVSKFERFVIVYLVTSDYDGATVRAFDDRLVVVEEIFSDINATTNIGCRSSVDWEINVNGVAGQISWVPLEVIFCDNKIRSIRERIVIDSFFGLKVWSVYINCTSWQAHIVIKSVVNEKHWFLLVCDINGCFLLNCLRLGIINFPIRWREPTQHVVAPRCEHVRIRISIQELTNFNASHSRWIIVIRIDRIYKNHIVPYGVVCETNFTVESLHIQNDA